MYEGYSSRARSASAVQQQQEPRPPTMKSLNSAVAGVLDVRAKAATLRPCGLQRGVRCAMLYPDRDLDPESEEESTNARAEAQRRDREVRDHRQHSRDRRGR